MSLSRDILSFISWLDENGDTFVLEHLKTAYAPFEEVTAAQRSENLRNQAIMQRAMALVAEGRMTPVTDSRSRLESALEGVRDVTGEDPLDTYFTVLALGQVSGYVDRWRKLRNVHLYSSPEPRVAAYFLQATTSFIFGLFDAVAILSRSVIQFALEEQLSRKGPELQLLKQARKDYLFSLVELAYDKGVLNVDLKQAAHDVRKCGNDAGHEKPCDEERAFGAIKKTRRVLVALYTGIKSA